MDWNALEQKWIKAWNEEKLFESTPDGRKKFFVTFPYPYMNGYSHLGHFYTLMRVEAFARYKRLRGFNVLFPQGWHCTGSPIEAAAQRIREKEEKQWKIMRDMGFPDKEIEKFGKPEHWVEYFPVEYRKDYERMGLAIDFRRSFITTSLNPRYDKFIQWQFRKLKEKGYVAKGRHAVVWCPKENTPVGDHARVEGEGETPQEFVLLKFRFDDAFLIAATLRPETVFGQTNLWVGPDITYVKADVDGETWIISEPAVKKLQEQDHAVRVVGKLLGKDLLGKKAVAPMIDRDIPILPASFCNPDKGTGIVTSVPSDAPDDYIGLRDLQRDKVLQQRHGLDAAMVDAVKPIPIIVTKEYGDQAAVKVVEDMKIKSQHDRAKLDEAKHLVYKAGFYAGTMGVAAGKHAGKPVKDVKDVIRDELVKKKQATLFYELTGKVVCRCLTQSVVKIVDNQWFVTYGDKKWKKITHQALNKLTLYPEKARQQFDYVLDWLNDWACTREYGLGTKLPWDQNWVIESLSDSTLYMAFYTISHLLEHVPVDHINDALFDFVFLGLGNVPSVPHASEMRKEFLYWYPVDFRNSGKDLIQNHLAFYIFTHTAIFHKSHWPAGIGVNGWVTVDGEKMSKSKGNFLLLRDLPPKFGVDPSRLTILSGGESLDDPNWDSELARTVSNKLESMHEFCVEHHDKGRADVKAIDKWFVAKLGQLAKECTDAMELTLFRTAIQKGLFELQSVLKWYLKRCGIPNKKAINQYITTQILLLAPFTPFICEETWKAIGKEGFVTNAAWPRGKEAKPEDLASEDVVRLVLDDVRQVLNIVKKEKPARITLIVADTWKHDLFKLLSQHKTIKNPGELIRTVMATALRQHGEEVTKILPKVMNKLPDALLTAEIEHAALKDALDFFEKEFNCPVVVQKESESQEPKAKQALPGKPAIVVA
ncbi:leucine--tRNA ligase [Candidatus Woesearchaeota archaeon]|nr:leucine--tRNA ligase [Candidatus Woesearchaeota archaeon]